MPRRGISLLPPYVPHQEINASRICGWHCVWRAADRPGWLHLDIEPVETPEPVRWLDDLPPIGLRPCTTGCISLDNRSRTRDRISIVQTETVQGSIPLNAVTDELVDELTLDQPYVHAVGFAQPVPPVHVDQTFDSTAAALMIWLSNAIQDETRGMCLVRSSPRAKNANSPCDSRARKDASESGRVGAQHSLDFEEVAQPCSPHSRPLPDILNPPKGCSCHFPPPLIVT